MPVLSPRHAWSLLPPPDSCSSFALHSVASFCPVPASPNTPTLRHPVSVDVSVTLPGLSTLEWEHQCPIYLCISSSPCEWMLQEMCVPLPLVVSGGIAEIASRMGLLSLGEDAWLHQSGDSLTSSAWVLNKYSHEWRTWARVKRAGMEHSDERLKERSEVPGQNQKKHWRCGVFQLLSTWGPGNLCPHPVLTAS